MGMFTQNYYNIFKLRSLLFFNSGYYAGSYQNNPSGSFTADKVYFTKFSDGTSVYYASQKINIPGSLSDGYNVCEIPFYSGALMYGNPTTYKYAGFNGGHYIYFITEDFEESIDYQFTSNTVTHKAISEYITQNENSSTVQINYTRTSTTPIYGLFIVFGFTMGLTSDATTLMAVYNHKFSTPITDNSFSLQISFNITSGEINVS